MKNLLLLFCTFFVLSVFANGMNVSFKELKTNHDTEYLQIMDLEMITLDIADYTVSDYSIKELRNISEITYKSKIAYSYKLNTNFYKSNSNSFNLTSIDSAIHIRNKEFKDRNMKDLYILS